jgi:aromatic-L-amino-acid decarboxylase
MLRMRLRKVGSDHEFRLRPHELGDLDDTACVVATVGTTAATAVDPVPVIADACARAGTWLHVDAAYAGAAMVCPEYRWAFEGVERADSVVVNAHKWMLTPMDCSLFFSRRPEALRDAFSLIPDYLRTPDAEDALSLSEYGPALGRRFRALKLWAVLRCHGRSGLQSHIRGGIGLAERFERWVSEEPGWELCAPRHFSVVCFRLSGSDERNQELLERVNASGEIFISGTVLAGQFVLRLAVGQMRTTQEDVAWAWEVLKREASGL